MGRTIAKSQSDHRPPGDFAPVTFRQSWLLGTPLTVTSYEDLLADCFRRLGQAPPLAIEFTNTHIVTQRRHDLAYRELTARYDSFVPDATPLVWCLNRRGAGMQDRVYGPEFMRRCLTQSPANVRHYLLGASPECGRRLREAAQRWNPHVQIVGSFHGRCDVHGHLEGSDDRVLDELRSLAPDLIWVGLGTPKQDAWVHRNKPRLDRGILLSVGFAFDVNAGTKPDAPLWMQQRGLTWLFRLASEPRRLAGRYLRYNSLFLFYLAWDGLRGRACIPARGV